MENSIEEAVRRKLEALAGATPLSVTDGELEEFLEENEIDDVYFSLRGEVGIVLHLPLGDAAIAVGLTAAGKLLYSFLDGEGCMVNDRTFSELVEDTRSWLWAALQE